MAASSVRLSWFCDQCEKECVPIRSESRCLCGHRLKDHDSDDPKLRCTPSKGTCSCPGFYYIFAEGSFILKCRCKHKHTEHDPISRQCLRPGCSGCESFNSPFVCNCDHGWACHRQKTSTIQQSRSDEISVAPEVNRWDLLKRGEGHDGDDAAAVPAAEDEGNNH